MARWIATEKTKAGLRHAVVCPNVNDWGGRGYDDFVPGKVTKTASSGDETT